MSKNDIADSDYKAFWTSVKKSIVLESPDRKRCTEWGKQILRGWKNSQKMDTESHNGRKDYEDEVMQDLFKCAVYTKKPYSLKFAWILESFLDEEKTTKKTRTMFFRCTMPVVWRNLEVPNEELRLSASSIILNFFPLIADDEFIKEEYISKQQVAMNTMLLDDCVPIRVMAIKKVPQHLCKHWKIFPRDMIKSYLEKIVDKLSLDAIPEVRAAVYEGMEELLPCADALTAAQRSLELLANRGINDRTEKVRLAAFKMLNKLHGHRYIKLLDLVPMPNLLLRLDFEHSSNVQKQIVKLIYRPFIPTQVEGIDYMVRFKRIYFMCKESWNASRHFHHLVYPLGLISIDIAVHHIRSLLLGVKSMLRKITGDENSDDSSDTLQLNVSGMSSVVDEQQNGEQNDKLKIAKDVLDSAIVLWMAIRFDLFEAKNAALNAEVTRMMSNILETLNQFPNETALVGSALVIARFLPKDKIGRMYAKIKSRLEQDDTKQPHYPHYVEALAAWDMNKLIEIIEKGLKKLRNDLIAITDPSKLMSTPRRRQATPLRGTDSPPSKRVKVVNELDELRRPLDLIQILLASPLTSEELKSNFTVHLEGFYESLSTIRKHFGKLVTMPGWERKFSPDILYAAYETFNIVALITKKIEEPRRGSLEEEEVNEAERNLPVTDRLIYNEMKWFASILRETTPTFQVIKMFLRCVNLHLASGKLTATLLNEMANMLLEIREIIEDAYDATSVELALKKSGECLKEALQNSDDLERAQRTIAQKVNPLLENLDDTETLREEENADEEQREE